MPWLAVTKPYAFDGPDGRASLPDLFEGRRQLVVYRAFFEPDVLGWPEHACHGCSMMADQVAPAVHLNARDTTFAYASRAPQPAIARLKQRMGWTSPGTRSPTGTPTSAWTSITARTCSSATATRCSARTSSTTAVTRRSAAPGATWT